MSTIFSRIVSGEIPCHKVLEDDRFLAFLDVFPLVEGHTLVIPRVEVDYIFDMEDEMLGEMMIFSKRAAAMIKDAVPCMKIGVSVIGLEVPHAHIHLIPMQQISDMNFSRPKLTVSQEDLSRTAERIRKTI
jgi:histidine triad (HIT) family protein